jgi:outer membrane protein assembly factor BamB
VTRTAPVALVLVLLGPPAAAQFPPTPPGPDAATVRGESTQTRKRLTEIEQLIAAGKTADVADELQRLLDEAGDDLVSVDGRLYVPARRYVHRFLARLPAAVLAVYRDRIDEPARKLLDLGRAARDPLPLRQLLDRYFVSRPAEDALLLLGELAFERGEFRAAEGYWRRLAPNAPADEYPYPAPRTDPATVRAKLAIAAVFQGDLTRANEHLAVLREKHLDATGRLAGRDGKYVETLAGLIADRPRLPPPNGDGTWATFGRNPERDGRTDGRLPFHWPNRPTWATLIPRDPAAARDRYPAKPPPVGAARGVAFHPVVVGDRAYLADAGRVFAFDLATGRPALVYDLSRDDPFSRTAGELSLPVRYDADFSLTASGHTLYARLGPPALFPRPVPNQPGRLKRQSYVVCLDVAGDAAQVRWSRSPPGANAPAAWEGAPLVVEGRVLAVFARSDGGRLVHTLACLGTDGRLLWTVDLCEAGAGPGGDDRHRHELLTRAGPNVVFCSNTGAVVAVDARTGKPAWAFRYPRMRKSPGETRRRDLNPPVASGGRVFVAPTDAEYLFVLDAETGRLLWQDGPLEISELFGVAAGNLVCTVAGPVRGIRGYDAATGSTDFPRGWANHDDPGLSSFGRGLVSDEHFVWPTQAGLFVLRTRDGTPVRQPIPGPHGNLAFAHGVLLCATPTELWGFVPPGRKLPDRENAAGVDTRPTLTDVIAHARAKLANPPTDRPSEPRAEIAIPPAVTERALPPPEVPVAQPTPVEPALGVASVVRTERRVIALIGERHLAAFDGDSGRIAWVLDALKRPRFDPFAGWPTRRFLPALYADAAHVVAYTAYGRRWVIDAATGAVTHDHPGPPPEYVSAPVRVAENLIVTATGPGQVVAFDPVTGRTVWEYDAGRPASLAGTAPLVWTGGGSVFVAVTRNVGVEIDRLLPSNGALLWPNRPAFIPAAEINPAATAVDDERLYVSVNDRLVAFRLDTGRPTWEAPLPCCREAPGWTILAAANTVVVLPSEARPAEPVPAVAARVARSFAQRPSAERLPGLASTLYDAWIDRTVPVLLLEPTTGRQLARLDLPARGPRVSAHLTTDGLSVRTGRAAYRLK